jgi:hypothetical protein
VGWEDDLLTSNRKRVDVLSFMGVVLVDYGFGREGFE